MKYLMSAIFLLASLSAKASFVVEDKGQAANFTYEDPQKLAPGTIKYNYKLVDFNDWDKNNPFEKKILNLFVGFQPSSDRPLIMYIGKASTVLDLPVEKVNVAEFRDINMIANLDKTVQVAPLKPNDVITYSEEKSFYRNPPAPARWCDGPNVNCLTTTLVLPTLWELAVKESTKQSKYHDIHAQAEFRTFAGNEITNSADLINLTGVKTAPGAEAIQSSFWFTHVFGFAKTIIVFQPNPDPKRPNTTVATAFMAFGIEKEKWDKSYNLAVAVVRISDVIMGKANGFNKNEGVACGLPCFTQRTAQSLAEALNK